MWSELADEPARALPLYAEAVQRLPHYTLANVHLAKLELGSGKSDEAATRLRGVLSRTEDAQALALLARLRLEGNPNDAEGQSLLTRARLRTSCSPNIAQRFSTTPRSFSAASAMTGPGDCSSRWTTSRRARRRAPMRW